MTKKKKNPSAGGRKGSRTWAYPVEFRLRIVRLYQESRMRENRTSGSTRGR